MEVIYEILVNVEKGESINVFDAEVERVRRLIESNGDYIVN
jgi:hypothetical protein